MVLHLFQAMDGHGKMHNSSHKTSLVLIHTVSPIVFFIAVDGNSILFAQVKNLGVIPDYFLSVTSYI